MNGDSCCVDSTVFGPGGWGAEQDKSSSPRLRPQEKAATGGPSQDSSHGRIPYHGGRSHVRTLPLQCAQASQRTFYGLATGTKEWTDPQTGQKVTRPLFDGTIFHRVIANFMIQGGVPDGHTAPADRAISLKTSSTKTSSLQSVARRAGHGQLRPEFQRLAILHHCTCRRRGLNDKHSIFGQCDDASVELVKKIARMPTSGENALSIR